MDSGEEKCRMIQSWTFSGLVGAFLDLAIAYLLLCVSAIAYTASKFLGFFGLCLPCPCNGLFGNPRANTCPQRVLVNHPAIQLPVKTKFPFDSTWMEDQNLELNMNSIRERSLEIVYASSSSVSARKEPKTEMDVGLCPRKSPALTKGKVDSKGVISLRGRSALGRCRRKATDRGMLSSSDASYDLMQDVLDVPQLPLGVRSKMGSEKTEVSSVEPLNSADGSEAAKDDGSQENFLSDFELSEAADENKSEETDAFTAEEFMYNEQEDVSFDHNDANTIIALEQALAQEHVVCSALYGELEKERTAAATAAEEAMNMILRLQEEKAVVEMEARQYQRIIEAKSTYDAEEMNILKEILLRREHEKHFLEKEVEAYRKKLFGKEHLDPDNYDILAMQGDRAALCSNVDPVLMLQQGISNSIDEKDKVKATVDFDNRDELKSSSTSTDFKFPFIESKYQNFLSGDRFQISDLDEVVGSSRIGETCRHESVSGSSNIHICDVEVQEKGMAFMDKSPLPQQKDIHWLECAESLGREEERNKNTTIGQGLEQKMIGTCDETSVPYDQGSKNNGKMADRECIDIDSCSLVSNKKPCVHGTGDGSVSNNELSGKVDESLYNPINDDRLSRRRSGSDDDRKGSSSGVISGLPPLGPSSGSGKASLPGLRRISTSAVELRSRNEAGWLREPSNDNSLMRKFGSEKGMSRSSTDLTSGLHPLGPSRGQPYSNPDLRRRSMSALDNERLKLETEVGWLREKLKMVQKGKEKLNISVEHKDREQLQFNFSDDIAKQIQGNRQLTGPGNAAREASLRPPSSKVKSKKRRRRSTSLEVPGSS